MVYKSFQNIKLSHLGMGNMRLPSSNPKDRDAPIDYAEAFKIIHRAYEEGINYYDTAYVYNAGDSEKCVGEAMKGFDRSSFYIATKFNLPSNPDYKAVFEEQLQRLQTDYIDFYLLHAVMDKNYENYLNSGAIDYFNELKAQGRIRYFGFSSHAGTEVLREFATKNDWDFCQIQLNYYDSFYGTADEEYQILTENNIPVVVMEPVRGGVLSSLTPEAESMLKKEHPDWSPAEWAFRFVKRYPNVKVILSGMSTMDQLVENCHTFADPDALSDHDTEVLRAACDLFKSQVQVPCTACRYCTPACPMGINIPAYMKVYNDYKVEGESALWHVDEIETDGKPADCVSCGACMEHCPQNIEIPVILGELAEAMK